MSTPILTTKLYLPPTRAKTVLRPRLIERLNEARRLTLVSAPAGFGKTVLVSAWAAGCGRPVAWLSLDEGDNDLGRFLIYFVAALQTLAAQSPAMAGLGDGVLGLLHASPPPIELILTTLLNQIAALPHPFVLVLDDYHVIDAAPVDSALAFILKHQPAQLHLVIATREDPPLPLARLRAREQLTELRVADLRFTPAEAAHFLNAGMGLNLSAQEIAALETRTEGWIAGLQLAALALQGTLVLQGGLSASLDASTHHKHTAQFIQSFTGSHHFVMDYLLEEVLQQQAESMQTFLLQTSILERLCGPLCDAVLDHGATSGQARLEAIEQANLFIVPLDDERRWYRYHHLFADLLRQRLSQTAVAAAGGVAELHRRASQWYEDQGLEIEAFHHAALAQDMERAERIIEGQGMPLQFRGGAVPIFNWLASLPTAVLDARPLLWVTYASVLLVFGQVKGVEEKAQAAEKALQGRPWDDQTRDLVGRIASIRATIAVTQHELEAIITQANRALTYLRPDNLPVRTSITWALGYAHHLQGNREGARQAYAEALPICQRIGHITIGMMCLAGLGQIQETQNELHQAAASYQEALQWVGEAPPPPMCEAYLGLARLAYQWNDLDKAQAYWQKSVPLARQIENTDRLALGMLFQVRLQWAQGDVAGAEALLAQAAQMIHAHHFEQQVAELVALQMGLRLQQGDVATAVALAEAHPLPLSQARLFLAQGETEAALAVLASYRQQVEAKGWQDERLKTMILQAVAFAAHGDKGQAVRCLGEALKVAEPGGFVRLFVDEGAPMMRLLSEASARGGLSAYGRQLLAALAPAAPKQPIGTAVQPLMEPLSPRELEVLRLIAQGLSNGEIAERLCLALSTVKGHNQIIFGKLEVQRRTEAIVRARALGLL